MSHQFSFLQVFAEYKFLQLKFVSIFKQNNKLERLRADLRVECSRRFGIVLQAGMSRFQAQICLISSFFGQMCFCWDISVYFDLSYQLCTLAIARLRDSRNQYIQWFKRLLLQLSSYENHSYIFNTCMIILLCKYLSQLRFLNKQQSICQLQAVECEA